MIKGQKGFVRLYRDIMDWGWYEDSNTARVFIHCLLKANYDDNIWRGIKIPRGSFVTSYAKLAEELNLTIQSIRTSLKHLISTCTITCKSTSKYSIITVNNYSSYQTNDSSTNNQLTNYQHSTNKQLTTTNKRNNGRKEEINYHYDVFEKLEEEARKAGRIE